MAGIADNPRLECPPFVAAFFHDRPKSQVIADHPGRILAAVAALILPVAIFVPRGLAPMLAIVAIGCLIAHFLATRRWPRPPIRLAVALVAFLAYAALTAVWSVTPARTLSAVPPLAGILLAAAIIVAMAAALDGGTRAAVQRIIIVGGTIGLVLIVFEVASHGLLIRLARTAVGASVPPASDTTLHLNSGITIAALFGWAWVMALRQRYSRIAAYGGAAILAAVLMLAKSDTPLAAYLVGAATYLLARWWPKRAPGLIGAILVSGALMAPLIPGQLPDPLTEAHKLSFLSNSAQHRILIWQTAAMRIAERPWFGHGFDTARALYPQSARVKVILRSDDPKRAYPLTFEPIPLHPHNMMLQVWLETGLVGALMVLGALLAVVAAVAQSRWSVPERAACYGFFATALFIALISFGAWQAWWLSGLWLAAALMVASLGQRHTS